MSAQSAPGVLSRELVEQRLDEVLARPEFQPAGRSWLERALEGLVDRLGASGLPESAGWVLLVVLLAMLGLLLGWLLVQLFAQLERRRATRTEAAPKSAEATHADRLAELRRLAHAARERGDLVLALRLSFFALVVGLSRRGELEYRDSWTNRELLERGSPAPQVAAELAPLLAELDAKTFGRVPVEPLDVERFERLAARWLGPQEARA